MGGPPQRLADRYQIQGEIGSGATAVTYRGWDERLERPVAVKILRSHVARDEAFVRRFEREARAAASVSHGNVVDIYDVGREKDVFYIIMQLVDGEDLKHLIQREGALPNDRVLLIIEQVLDGLHAIHRAGIIHRDAKPQNILLGRDGVARLTDFGIAQGDNDVGTTTAGTTVGTAAYMAPEQAQAERISQATDLYAVGVVLYEMLTGFLPFNAPSTMALMLEHIQTPPVPPSQRLPGAGISPAMDSVVLQCLAKNPADRFQSARDLKHAMTRTFVDAIQRTSQRTVTVPGAQGTRAMSAKGVQQSRPPQQRRMDARTPPPADVGRERRGLGGVVSGFALLFLFAVAGVAAWYAFDAWQGAHTDKDPAPTQTVPAVIPTSTVLPAATEQPGVIEPIDRPTETMIPTEQPEPIETPEPTATNPPEPTATDEAPLIEPLDGTPISFAGG